MITVVLPLANGQLCRVTLDADNPRKDIGPDWRTQINARLALPETS